LRHYASDVGNTILAHLRGDTNAKLIPAQALQALDAVMVRQQGGA
jgi:hypothetical protein